MARPYGQRIREARLKSRHGQGMSQVELAKLVGVTKQQMNNIEQDRSDPSVEVLGKIAKALGVTSDVLLGIRRSPSLSAYSKGA